MQLPGFIAPLKGESSMKCIFNFCDHKPEVELYSSYSSVIADEAFCQLFRSGKDNVKPSMTVLIEIYQNPSVRLQCSYVYLYLYDLAFI